ncbi:hypothetical protein D3273_23745 [Lichenibacterium minor]|uniref:Carbohydrate kinase PfkB domain-containing protein n=1 Tax=Lichenibacterium minor TaxID=2316528 RepID=A0A4Q2TZF0_9HYPH|nr:PfkB family carbohydrate kinase [Lichenibacterium minor]RYC29499.1 hypothetical protein D3273_23745 [Lichenibacterium minor]
MGRRDPAAGELRPDIGVAAADRAGLAVTIPAIPVAVKSTHGAGDAFVGTFAAALATGAGLEAGLAAANREASRLVSTPEHLR